MSNASRILRQIVNERGQNLRKLPFDQLKTISQMERVMIDKREATISVSAEPLASGGVLIVVQGFMKSRWFGGLLSAFGLDGFYKYPDETMAMMTREDIFKYD